jgi:two-component system response regulator HydG
VLVVDTDETTRDTLVMMLEGAGFVADQAENGEAALRLLAQEKHDALVAELALPDVDGFDLLTRARETRRDLIVVVTSAVTDVETIVRAMRTGTEDYLAKPIRHELVTRALDRALSRRALVAPEAPKHRLEDIVGTSAAMRRVLDVVSQIAPSRASVLVTGESGTGKGLIAQAIHDRSDRKDAPFIKLQCSALAETLLEVGQRGGRFDRIDGGTIFLDEIGELSLPMQVKLLRFLQERTIEPVGPHGPAEPVEVDVRVIAATHRNLASEVIAGRFREDLYYRLNVVNVDLPPLRARPSDVAPLATHFLERFARENGKAITGFEEAATQKLTGYRWPGNVRELENTIEHAVVLCDEGPLVLAKHLPSGLTGAHREVRAPGATMAEIERDAIIATLDAVGGNTAKAAKMLDVSVRKIQYRLREYGIEPARRRKKTAT